MQFTTTLLPLAALAPALAAEVGATGVIDGLDGGLEGTVTVKDENTLEVTGYTLEDGSAPDLYWWGSETEDISKGWRINNEQVRETASDDTIEIPLNAGYTASDFSYVSLWCESLSVNFGQAELVEGDSISGSDNASETTSSDSASETTDSSDTSGAGVKIGASAAGALAAAAALAALML